MGTVSLNFELLNLSQVERFHCIHDEVIGHAGGQRADRGLSPDKSDRLLASRIRHGLDTDLDGLRIVGLRVRSIEPKGGAGTVGISAISFWTFYHIIEYQMNGFNKHFVAFYVIITASGASAGGADDYIFASLTEIVREVHRQQASTGDSTLVESRFSILANGHFQSIDGLECGVSLPRVVVPEGGRSAIGSEEFVEGNFLWSATTALDDEFPSGDYEITYFKDVSPPSETTVVTLDPFRFAPTADVRFHHQRWEDGCLVLPLEMPLLRFSPVALLRFAGDTEEHSSVSITDLEGNPMGERVWRENSGSLNSNDDSLDFRVEHLFDLTGIVVADGNYRVTIVFERRTELHAGNTSIILIFRVTLSATLKVVADSSVLNVPEVAIHHDSTSGDIALRWNSFPSQSFAVFPLHDPLPPSPYLQIPFASVVVPGTDGDSMGISQWLIPREDRIASDIFRLRVLPR